MQSLHTFQAVGCIHHRPPFRTLGLLYVKAAKLVGRVVEAFGELVAGIANTLAVVKVA